MSLPNFAPSFAFAGMTVEEISWLSPRERELMEKAATNAFKVMEQMEFNRELDSQLAYIDMCNAAKGQPLDDDLPF
jgi:hypothetical protein